MPVSDVPEAEPFLEDGSERVRERSFKAGDIVTSAACGCVPRFRGRVVALFEAARGLYYHVENIEEDTPYHRSVWHRVGAELVLESRPRASRDRHAI